MLSRSASSGGASPMYARPFSCTWPSVDAGDVAVINDALKALEDRQQEAAAEEQARLEQQLAEQQAAGVALGAGRVSWIRGRAA